MEFKALFVFVCCHAPDSEFQIIIPTCDSMAGTEFLQTKLAAAAQRSFVESPDCSLVPSQQPKIYIRPLRARRAQRFTPEAKLRPATMRARILALKISNTLSIVVGFLIVSVATKEPEDWKGSQTKT
jgi:hypothetical protein